MGRYQSVDLGNFEKDPLTQDFSYARILKQKVYEQPKPRYIRDNMNVNDINGG